MIRQSSVFECAIVTTNGLHQAIITRDFGSEPFTSELLAELEGGLVRTRVVTSPETMDAIRAVYTPLGDIAEWDEDIAE